MRLNIHINWLNWRNKDGGDMRRNNSRPIYCMRMFFFRYREKSRKQFKIQKSLDVGRSIIREREAIKLHIKLVRQKTQLYRRQLLKISNS